MKIILEIPGPAAAPPTWLYSVVRQAAEQAAKDELPFSLGGLAPGPARVSVFRRRGTKTINIRIDR